MKLAHIPTSFIFLTAIFFALATVVYKSTRTVRINHPKTTYGEIVSFSSSGGASGSNARIRYCVGDCYYSSIDMTNGMVIGEKFAVEYEATNPEKSIVHKSQPLFLDDEKTEKSIGYISDVGLVGNGWVRFKYSVNNVPFWHFQNFKKTNLQPQIGERYMIKYWLDDPRRSIIYLDQPVK